MPPVKTALASKMRALGEYAGVQIGRGLCAVLLSVSASPAALAVNWQGAFELGLITGRGQRVVAERNNYAGVSADGQGSVSAERWRLWARVTWDSRYDGAFGNIDAQPDLREFALRFSGIEWDLSVGRQQIVWGRADGFNPSNVLGVRDVARLAIWDDELYRGVDVARLDWRPASGQQFSLYVLPHWRPSRLVASFERALSQVESERSRAVQGDKPGFALRYEQLGSGLDGALSVGRVADFSPYIRFDPDGFGSTAEAFIATPTAAAPTPILQRRFGEVWFAAGDFAWTLDAWVLRGELAYIERESSPSAPRDEFSAVFGAERELGERLSLNLQLIHSRFDDLIDPAQFGLLGQAIDVTGQVFHQQRPHYSGAALGLNLLPANYLGRLETTVLGFRGGEWLFRIRGEYSLGEQGKIEALGERYGGRQGSTFAGLSDNNGFWLRWSYTWAN